MLTMARFFESNNDDIDFYREASTAKNTKLSTGNWMNIYNSWAKCRNFVREIHLYEPAELNEILKKFYVEIRKVNGDHYEPSCLRVMMASLDRHLKNKNYGKSVARDREFSSSREVLEGVARLMRQNGKGKKPNRARSLSNDDISSLWACGQLGSSNPRSLIQTIWWNNCLHFGLRSREEHHNIQIEDFEFKVDNSGTTYITYQEGLTKTRNGGLNFKPRLIFPRMFTTGGVHCPVNLFRLYVSHRPLSLKTAGPFYLAVIDKPKSNIWYKTSPMGVHTINNILKSMKNNSPLANSSKKITNHSARKTVVRKLRESGFPKCEIKNLTGHSTEKGLDPYDSGDDTDLKKMSFAVHPVSESLRVDSPPTGIENSYQQQQQHQRIINESYRTMSMTTFTPNFSFGMNEESIHEGYNNCERPSYKPVYNNCTFNINTNMPSASSTTTKQIRRRVMIESDSENSQE